MTPAARERKLTTNVVALRFGVTSTTVRRWIQNGQLRAERTPGGQIRVPESALEAYESKKTSSK